MHDIERVQIRALAIIHPNLTYWQALDTYKLETLEQRRISLCQSTYESIKDPNNIVHNLLPPTRHLTYNLRNPRNREIIRTRVKRSDGSFINYAVAKFD